MEDDVTFADIVNHKCEKSQLKSLTKNQFKCLIFIARLQLPNDVDIRTRLVSKLEQYKDITVKALTIECDQPQAGHVEWD